MSVISARILQKIAAVSQGPAPPGRLLRDLGVPTEPPGMMESPPLVSAEVYYALLERCGADDATLPLRYGASVLPEDFGAFGLALKTASDVGDALERLARYILVVSDTLEYSLVDEPGGRAFVLNGRPAHRRGVQLANECALAAILRLMRCVAEQPVAPRSVSFRHPGPPDGAAHDAYFGAPVRFGAPGDGLYFDDAALATPTHLADEALSTFLLSQLEELHAQRAEGAVVHQVRRVIADRLCSGMPKRDDVARHLGMSARTLHRRLAEHGCSFQDVANQVRREVAESLLTRHSVSVGEVAYLSGFSDQSAFQRAFKTWTGQTPARFRQRAS